MVGMQALLKQWELDERAVRDRMYGAPTPRERERWHALWLLARGWSEAQVATALERDAHTIGTWVNAFGAAGPPSVTFEQTGGSPPPSTPRRKRI
jgi:transposase